MTAELICIATQDISNKELKQCAQYLIKELFDMGIDVTGSIHYAPDKETLGQLLENSRGRSNIVFMLGALDPDNGGFSVETASRVLSVDTEERNIGLRKLSLPKRCAIFQSKTDSHPGCAFAAGSQLVVAMPSRASEFSPMFNDHARKFLEKFSPGTVSTHIIELTGISADETVMRMSEIAASKNPEIRIKERDGKVALILTARAATRSQGKQLINPVRESLNDIFSDYIHKDAPQSLQQTVVDLLRRKSLTISTAESCTAGLISKCLTEIPGSSSVFLCGVAAYTGEIKHNILGVKKSTIERYGEVSPEVAAAMAIGARQISASSLGIGVTGIAGPGGGTPDKPVGLVYFALADSGRVWIKKLKAAEGRERDYVRTLAANSALELVRQYLASLPEVLDGSISLTSYKTNPAFIKAVTTEKENIDTENQPIPENVVVDYNQSVDVEEFPQAAVSAMPLSAPDLPGSAAADDNIAAYDASRLTDDDYEEADYKDGRDKHLGKLTGFLIAVFILLTIGIAAMFMMPQIQSWVSGQNNPSASAQTENVAPDPALFEGLSDDVKAVLYVPSSTIKAPVSLSGAPLEIGSDDGEALQYYNKTVDPSNDRMILILGGQSGLTSLKDPSILESHDIINVDTRERRAAYRVFAVGYMNDNDLRLPFDAANGGLSTQFADELTGRSLLDTGVKVGEDDSIVVIAVDSDEYPDYKFYVAAKRVSLDEEPSGKANQNSGAFIPPKAESSASSGEPASQASSQPSSAPESSAVESSSSRASSSSTPSGTPSSSKKPSSIPSSSKKPSSTPSSSKKPSSTPSSSKKPSSSTSSSSKPSSTPSSSKKPSSSESTSQTPPESSGEPSSESASNPEE